MDSGPWETPPPAREPLFRAPLVVLLVCAALVGVHAALWFGHVPASEVLAPYALTGQAMTERRWIPLFTHIFLHAGWTHVLMNAGFALAFGAAPAQLFGRTLRGALVFLGFFLACGAIAGLGYAAIQPDRDWAVIGASGAVAGLMGATSRMLNPGGRLGPPWGRGFASMTVSWVALNALLGFTGIGASLSGGLQIAWQLHIIGYFAGVGLVGLFWGLAGRRDPITE